MTGYNGIFQIEGKKANYTWKNSISAIISIFEAYNRSKIGLVKNRIMFEIFVKFCLFFQILNLFSHQLSHVVVIDF